MAIRWPLFVRRTHKWLALVVGIQALLWTLTGFYMVVVHIDTIHGDDLVRSPASQPFDLEQGRQIQIGASIGIAGAAAGEQDLGDHPPWRHALADFAPRLWRRCPLHDDLPCQ